MAQARHAMGGPKSVSSLQYDAVMTPLVSIELSTEAESYEELLTKTNSDSDWVEFRVKRIVPGKPVKRSRMSESGDSIIDGGSLLRQRTKADDTQDPMSCEMKPLNVDALNKTMTSLKLKDNEEQETYELKEEVKDPLKWFGVLVPQTLRQSQQHFTTGTCTHM